MNNQQTMDIKGITYEYAGAIEKITIADSFVMPSNKVGEGNGEAKLYVGQRDSSVINFFGGKRGFGGHCILLKSNLLKYLNDAKGEYFEPSYEYRRKNSLRELWYERINRISGMDEIIHFNIEDQNQLAGPRVYVNASDGSQAAYKLIREIPLPVISYLDIIKLKSHDGDILYYFKLVFNIESAPEGEIEKEMFRTQVCGILDYFKGFENEYGLLERLDGWNFVEWSKLNDRVFDVSWPTNMLYAAALDRVAELFGISDYAEKSRRLKQTICDMAYNGVIFADRAVRNKNGELVTTDEVSQTAQYYALKFKTVPEDDERFKRLKDIILKDRESEFERFGEVEPADVLPGMYIKMELLLKWGAYDRLKQEIKRYFLCMARQTSTLWERKNGKCSLDHGFASYICVLIKSICGE